MKVALYARYSSDNQRDASITDQIRICRAFAEREGWTIADEFHDHAISGATLLRPGFQALMRRALNREFHIVLAESLDRFSRDQEDTAGLFKRLTFLGVRIVTLSEGEITHLHVGLKGTMNALFLKDLADKTRRGLRGRGRESKPRSRSSFSRSRMVFPAGFSRTRRFGWTRNAPISGPAWNVRLNRHRCCTRTWRTFTAKR